MATKKDPRFGPDRVEALKRCVPKGKIRTIELLPLKGETIAPMTWGDLGLAPREERKAA